MKCRLLLLVLFCLFVVGCNDSDKDSDIFVFEGGESSKILDIEVINSQNESLLFKTNESKSIFQTQSQKPTLLFFISQSCQECQDELMHILDLHTKFQEFISIIAISPKNELDSMQKQVDLINPRFKLYAPKDNKNLLDFLNKDSQKSYIALYDKNGEKITDYIGLVPEEMIELDITYLIQSQLDLKTQQELKTFTQEELQEQSPQLNPQPESNLDSSQNGEAKND